MFMKETFTRDLTFQMREKQWMAISPEAKDLVHRMLEVDSEHRITIEEALAHPWIRVNTSQFIIFLHTRARLFETNNVVS